MICVFYGGKCTAGSSGFCDVIVSLELHTCRVSVSEPIPRCLYHDCTYMYMCTQMYHICSKLSYECRCLIFASCQNDGSLCFCTLYLNSFQQGTVNDYKMYCQQTPLPVCGCAVEWLIINASYANARLLHPFVAVTRLRTVTVVGNVVKGLQIYQVH